MTMMGQVVMEPPATVVAQDLPCLDGVEDVAVTATLPAGLLGVGDVVHGDCHGMVRSLAYDGVFVRASCLDQTGHMVTWRWARDALVKRTLPPCMTSPFRVLLPGDALMPQLCGALIDVGEHQRLLAGRRLNGTWAALAVVNPAGSAESRGPTLRSLANSALLQAIPDLLAGCLLGGDVGRLIRGCRTTYVPVEDIDLVRTPGPWTAYRGLIGPAITRIACGHLLNVFVGGWNQTVAVQGAPYDGVAEMCPGQFDGCEHRLAQLLACGPTLLATAMAHLEVPDHERLRRTVRRALTPCAPW